MNERGVKTEGLIVGLLGAAAIALWFLIVDTIAGQPFFTPAMLGSAFFWGSRDPSAVEVSIQTVASYTMVHVLAFVVIGFLAAAMARQVERAPSTIFIAIVFLIAVEFGFYIVLAILGPPLLGAFAWWSVAIGNAIAIGAMALYLWRTHPRIRDHLARHPLGSSTDESSDSFRAL
jgi:hypothetical protein